MPVSCFYTLIKNKSPIKFKIDVDITENIFFSRDGVEVKEAAYGTGDGDVDLNSLSICKKWKSTVKIVTGSICHGCYTQKAEYAEILATQ